MDYSNEKLERIRMLYEHGVVLYKNARANTINLRSPYSKCINCLMDSTAELEIYLEQNLTEQFITRPSLIMCIDPAYCGSDGESNLTRMRNGKPPIDSITGTVIDLHHIGQKYDSPFAELPHAIHNSPACSSLLHQNNKSSWRNNKDLYAKTLAEVKKYWKIRSEMYL